MKDAILRYCKGRMIVDRHTLESWVDGICRMKTGYHPAKGHVWACTRGLVKSGYIDGMVRDNRTLGVADVKLTVPKTKKQTKQPGFGWGEKE